MNLCKIADFSVGIKVVSNKHEFFSQESFLFALSVFTQELTPLARKAVTFRLDYQIGLYAKDI
jgi:hypothetical protein